ncbi:MAG: PRD domain-containing protein [Oscillospiraceae bacterium]|nr:PRD domain-containing protein [Oscillospiraceae bacterium]
MIENHFHIMVDRNSFNFSRYATHLQYLFQRIQQDTTIDSENLRLYKDLREEFPEIAACVEKVADHIGKKWHCTLSEEEKLYLILHVNRIMAKGSI